MCTLLLIFPECFDNSECKYGQCGAFGMCFCGLGQIKEKKTCKPGKSVHGKTELFSCKLVTKKNNILQPDHFLLSYLVSDIVRQT